MLSLALEDFDRMAELVLIAFGVAALALLLLEVIYLAVVLIFLAPGPGRVTSGSRRFILILGFGIAGLSACGPPKLFHFDGQPFALHGPIEMLSDGWLAVDSCARGRHALLEIEVDTIDVKTLGNRQRFALWIGTEQVGWVHQVVVDGPVCHIGPERRSEMYQTSDPSPVLGRRALCL